MSGTIDSGWRFDRNYRNLGQVADFLPAYYAVHDELVAAGQYPYNDSFRGRIPGIEGPDEESAVYLLQSCRHLAETWARVIEAQQDGCVPVPKPDGFTKYRRIVWFGWEMGGTGYQEWREARLGPGFGSYAVLAKGKRTRGHLLTGGVVMAAP